MKFLSPSIRMTTEENGIIDAVVYSDWKTLNDMCQCGLLNGFDYSICHMGYSEGTLNVVVPSEYENVIYDGQYFKYKGKVMKDGMDFDLEKGGVEVPLYKDAMGFIRAMVSIESDMNADDVERRDRLPDESFAAITLSGDLESYITLLYNYRSKKMDSEAKRVYEMLDEALIEIGINVNNSPYTDSEQQDTHGENAVASWICGFDAFGDDEDYEYTDSALKHADICDKLHDLYMKKNRDYGDSFSKTRREYPNAICIRLSDKLSRLKTLLDANAPLVKDESIEDTLLDIANYAIIELVERALEK